MKYLRPEERKLRRFAKCHFLDQLRPLDLRWIGCHHAVHVRPDLDLFHIQGRAENCGRVIRASPTDRGWYPGQRCPQKSLRHHDVP